jgi:hypothetical protein
MCCGDFRLKKDELESLIRPEDPTTTEKSLTRRSMLRKGVASGVATLSAGVLATQEARSQTSSAQLATQPTIEERIFSFLTEGLSRNELITFANSALARMSSAREIEAEFLEDEEILRTVRQGVSLLRSIAAGQDLNDMQLAALYTGLIQTGEVLYLQMEPLAKHGTKTFNCRKDMKECQEECKQSGKKLCGCAATFLVCLIFG